MDKEELQIAMAKGLENHCFKSVSIRELQEGNGTMAEAGSFVTVHYRVTLIGDDTIVEDTRASGYGDRDFGQPLTFELGDLGNSAVLRALHAAVLDMRVGGRRRVRTAMGEPDFGYREEPAGVYTRDCEGRRVPRKFQADWLIDVEISLLAVSNQPPPSRLAMAATSVLPAAVVDTLRGFGVLR